MILAMSFNVYIFFSITLGFAFGTLLTGHWHERAASAVAASDGPAGELLLKVASPQQIFRLRIDGMACDSCAETTEKALLRVGGVQSATVDFGGALAIVVAVGTIAADLQAAIKGLGYTAALEQIKVTSSDASSSGSATSAADAAVISSTDKPLEQPLLINTADCCRG